MFRFRLKYRVGFRVRFRIRFRIRFRVTLIWVRLRVRFCFPLDELILLL